MSELKPSTAVFALIGAVAMLGAMPLFTAWWMYWGYGIEPVSWPGLFIPVLCSLVVAASIKALVARDKD